MHSDRLKRIIFNTNHIEEANQIQQPNFQIKNQSKPIKRANQNIYHSEDQEKGASCSKNPPKWCKTSKLEQKTEPKFFKKIRWYYLSATNSKYRDLYSTNVVKLQKEIREIWKRPKEKLEFLLKKMLKKMIQEHYK